MCLQFARGVNWCAVDCSIKTTLGPVIVVCILTVLRKGVCRGPSHKHLLSLATPLEKLLGLGLRTHVERLLGLSKDGPKGYMQLAQYKCPPLALRIGNG